MQTGLTQYLAVALMFLLSACSEMPDNALSSAPEETPAEQQDKTRRHADLTPAVFATPRNALEENILSRPKLAAARKLVEAKAYGLQELEAGQKIQLGLSGDAGVTAGHNDQGVQPAVNVALNASKKISDGGRYQAQRKAAEIAIDQARLEYAIRSNAVIEKILMAYNDMVSAQKTIAVIEKNLNAYHQRETQIDAAAEMGALTNVDLIEIKTVKGKIETQKLEAELSRNAAQSVLNKYLSTAGLRKLAHYRQTAGQKSPQKAPDFQAQAMQYGAEFYNAQATAARLTNKPQISAIARANLPGNDDNGIGLSVGLSVNWVFNDGGAAKAAARRLELEREAALLEREGQITLAQLTSRNLAIMRENAEKQRRLFRQRIALSKERIAEQEALLTAGRANVVTIARELLNGAETEIMLHALNAEQERQQIIAFSGRAATCALINMCDLFQLESAR